MAEMKNPPHSPTAEEVIEIQKEPFDYPEIFNGVPADGVETLSSGEQIYTYNGLREATKKRSGMYEIYKGSELVYIGFSGVDLYKTIQRHFQAWEDEEQRRYTVNPLNVRVVVYAIPPREAAIREAQQILEQNPEGNKTWDERQVRQSKASHSSTLRIMLDMAEDFYKYQTEGDEENAQGVLEFVEDLDDELQAIFDKFVLRVYRENEKKKEKAEADARAAAEEAEKLAKMSKIERDIEEENRKIFEEAERRDREKLERLQNRRAFDRDFFGEELE